MTTLNKIETGYGKGGYKPRHSKKKATVKSLDKKVSKLTHQIRTENELKYIDTAVQDTELDSGITFTLLNASDQETGSGNIIGQTYKMVSVDYRVRIVNNQNSSLPDIFNRVMLVLDRQPNGAGFTRDQLLQASAAGIQQIQSHLEMENKHRFKVLRNDVIKVTISSENTSGYIQRHVKLNNLKVYRNDDPIALGIITIKTNALWLLAWSEFGIGDPAEDKSTYDARIRLRYTDS